METYEIENQLILCKNKVKDIEKSNELIDLLYKDLSKPLWIKQDYQKILPYVEGVISFDDLRSPQVITDPAFQINKEDKVLSVNRFNNIVSSSFSGISIYPKGNVEGRKYNEFVPSTIATSQPEILPMCVFPTYSKIDVGIKQIQDIVLPKSEGNLQNQTNTPNQVNSQENKSKILFTFLLSTGGDVYEPHVTFAIINVDETIKQNKLVGEYFDLGGVFLNLSEKLNEEKVLEIDKIDLSALSSPINVNYQGEKAGSCSYIYEGYMKFNSDIIKKDPNISYEELSEINKSPLTQLLILKYAAERISPEQDLLKINNREATAESGYTSYKISDDPETHMWINKSRFESVNEEERTLDGKVRLYNAFDKDKFEALCISTEICNSKNLDECISKLDDFIEENKESDKIINLMKILLDENDIKKFISPIIIKTSVERIKASLNEKINEVEKKFKDYGNDIKNKIKNYIISNKDNSYYNLRTFSKELNIYATDLKAVLDLTVEKLPEYVFSEGEKINKLKQLLENSEFKNALQTKIQQQKKSQAYVPPIDQNIKPITNQIPPGDSYDPNVPKVKKPGVQGGSKVSSEKLGSNKQLNDLQNLNNIILALKDIKVLNTNEEKNMMPNTKVRVSDYKNKQNDNNIIKKI